MMQLGIKSKSKHLKKKKNERNLKQHQKNSKSRIMGFVAQSVIYYINRHEGSELCQ